MIEIQTLNDLKGAFRSEVSGHEGFGATADGATHEDKLAACDALTEMCVSYAHHRQPKSEHDQKRMRRKIEAKANDGRCGFVPLVLIGGAILSWLVGKALDWFWAWWNQPKSPQLACGMMLTGTPAVMCTNWDGE